MTFDGSHWSPPAPVVPLGDQTPGFPSVSVVSCISASYCVVIENSAHGGPSYAQTFDGKSWSALTGIGASDVSGIACATPTMCVAVDEHGEATAFDGSGWSAPTVVDPGGRLSSISCPSVSSCMAVGGANGTVYAYVYNGAVWTAAGGATKTVTMAGVSCVSATRCVAVGGHRAASYDGTTWSSLVNLSGSEEPLSAVSCAARSRCVAVAGNQYLVFNGTSWSGAASMSSKSLDATSISCVLSHWCMSVAWLQAPLQWPTDGLGYALTFDGTAWSRPKLIDRSRYDSTGLSCPAVSFCVSVDTTGFAVTRTGMSWQQPAYIDPGGFTAAVSCASASFCVAVDGRGYVVSYDGVSWSRPKEVYPNGLQVISCPTSSFCIAVSGDGTATTFDGSSWHQAKQIAPKFYAASLSCVSATFCVAVGSKGSATYAMTFHGTGWSPTPLGRLSTPMSLSCGSPTLCVAVDYEGHAEIFDGSAWHRQSFRSHGDVRAVSCSSTCVAVDGRGNAISYDGQAWGAPVTIFPDGGLNSVSCQASGACDAISYRGWSVGRSPQG